ncbi:MAG: sigma-54-dependent Fis family transcriptional regulator [Planctomyces sp.]|nr:sigma-54-dependent Fis family transcriptional regulator [Planctomyces sp.]
METLLLIDDEAGIRSTIRSILQSDELQVLVAATADEGLELMARERPPIVLLDLRLGTRSGLDVFDELKRINPRALVIFITGHGTTETAIETMKLGAFDYLVKPLDLDQLSAVVDQARRICRQMYAPAALDYRFAPETGSDRLIGSGPAMQSICKQIGRVAPQDVNVLVLGESGTGKELIARAIYQHSRRSQHPFLAINCAAIPETLLESELFGHEKGAFTGADHRRIGKFEQCHHGTIFLDEVGDMPLSTQARMLRLLQNGQFQRVGGNETLTADVRVIAATHQNLEAMIADGRFRQDLYYRLRGVTLQLPPLRERTEDIPELAHYMMFRFNQQLGTSVQTISPEALERLQAHPWPGNIRELQSVLREALIVSSGPSLLAEFLPLEARSDVPEDVVPADSNAIPSTHEWQLLGHRLSELLETTDSDIYRNILQEFDHLVVRHAMNVAGGRQSRAAELLGISRPTLRLKVRAIAGLSNPASVEDKTLPD